MYPRAVRPAGARRRIRRTNEDYLFDLAARHGLGIADVARLTRSTEHAAKAWLRPAGNAAHRRIPDGLLELLALKLGEPSPFRDD